MNAQPEKKPALTDPVVNSASLQEPAGAQSMLDPFSDAQVKGLFFPGAGRQDTLEQLQHLLRYGPALLVLDGDAGVGKQFLMNRMLAMLDPDLFELALIQANVLNSPDAISSALSSAWNCTQELTPQNRQQVLSITAQAADNESKTLLAIVRHAEHLSAESCLLIRELLAISAGLPVKFLLVVDAVELEAVGYLYELITQVPDNFQLTLYPLNLEETKEYLAYRLRTAGLGQVRFNDDQIKKIFNHSLGNIQQINEVARDLLHSSLPSPQPKQTPSSLPKMHLIALGVMLAVLTALVLVRDYNVPEEPAAPAANSTLASSSVEHATPQSVEITQTQATGEDQLTQAGEVASAADLTMDSSLEPVSDAADAMPDDQEDSSVSELEDAAPMPAPEAAPEAEIALPQEAVVVDPAPTEAKPQPEPGAEKTGTGEGERTDWVLALPKDDYVLQLLGAREWGTVEAFLKRYKAVKDLAYYKMMRQGVPWYVVLQGSFPDHDAASAAVEKLPESLQKQGPWIRKVEVIQGELKN